MYRKWLFQSEIISLEWQHPLTTINSGFVQQVWPLTTHTHTHTRSPNLGLDNIFETLCARVYRPKPDLVSSYTLEPTSDEIRCVSTAIQTWLNDRLTDGPTNRFRYGKTGSYTNGQTVDETVDDSLILFVANFKDKHTKKEEIWPTKCVCVSIRSYEVSQMYCNSEWVREKEENHIFLSSFRSKLILQEKFDRNGGNDLKMIISQK